MSLPRVTSATSASSSASASVTTVAPTPSTTTDAPTTTADPPGATTVAPAGTGLPTIPGVEAAAYVVIDADTGEVLAGSNADQQLPVGSLMKLLTAYVTMEAGDPTKLVTVPALDKVDDESIIGLSPGQKFGRDLLLRALLVVSAGDAAQTLALDVGGSEENFVAMMNDAAASLGMTATAAANETGLDAAGAHSSAADVAAISRILMQDPTFRDTVDNRTAKLNGQTLASTNQTFLTGYDGATGVKTGHTTEAGYCLAASATRNGRSLIAVVLGTPSKAARNAAAEAALDWGFTSTG